MIRRLIISQLRQREISGCLAEFETAGLAVTLFAIFRCAIVDNLPLASCQFELVAKTEIRAIVYYDQT